MNAFFFNRCILSSKKLFILLVSPTVIKWHLRFLKVNIHLIQICWGWPKTRGSLWKAECSLCVSQRELFLPESFAEGTPITKYTAFQNDEVITSTKYFVLWYTKKYIYDSRFKNSIKKANFSVNEGCLTYFLNTSISGKVFFHLVVFQLLDKFPHFQREWTLTQKLFQNFI